MSRFEGLAFLFAGVGLFVFGICMMMARERSSHRPKKTVAHFQRSRRAMRKMFSDQVQRREAARARAVAQHPARAASTAGQAQPPSTPSTVPRGGETRTRHRSPSQPRRRRQPAHLRRRRPPPDRRHRRSA